MIVDQELLKLLQEHQVTSARWDADGNLLAIEMGPKKVIDPIQELVELTPEQLKAEAERIMFAHVE